MHITLSSRGDYEICSICNWEDDPIQSEDPMFYGGANKMSLSEAQVHWRYGVSNTVKAGSSD